MGWGLGTCSAKTGGGGSPGALGLLRTALARLPPRKGRAWPGGERGVRAEANALSSLHRSLDGSRPRGRGAARAGGNM